MHFDPIVLTFVVGLPLVAILAANIGARFAPKDEGAERDEP